MSSEDTELEPLKLNENEPVPLVDKPRWWEGSNVSYHARNGYVSATALIQFMRSVKGYYHKYMSDDYESTSSSKALDFGSAFHTLILEPDSWEDDVAVTPVCKKTSRANKIVWEEFEKEHRGKLFVSPVDRDAMLIMENALRTDTEASKWLWSYDDTRYEVGLLWKDRLTGIGCKCRPDGYIPSCNTILNLKTAADPSPEGIVKSMANYRYHNQAAFYMEGLYEMYGEWPRHISIIVGTKAPYEVACVEYSEKSIRLARLQNERALREMMGLENDKEWVGRTANKLIEVDLPAWAYKGYEDFV
jgi:hypothetical protein